MFQDLTPIAVTLQSCKGCLALLLGSGISRTAGIPTGWEIVLDLIEKIAHLEAEEKFSDLTSWFQRKYNEEPSYSKLLEILAPTPAARQQLLRSYFEPTEAEREQSLKLPTVAHRAIADLVSLNAARIIITTNFDRLLELALEDVGIRPAVIWNDDSLSGAVPIAHSHCTIIKVHGDYLDTRIKNSPDELGFYDPGIRQFLERIFADYGLIVSGWSAEYDVALRDVLSRAPHSSYPSYWTAISEPSVAAKDLISKRNANLIRVNSADKFFSDLTERVRALDELANNKPLTTKIAVATAKRFMADHRFEIRLYDLVTDQINHSFKKLEADKVLNGDGPNTKEEFQRRLSSFEHTMLTPIGLFAEAAYWKHPNRGLLLGFEKYLTLAASGGAGLVHHLELKKYPAVLLYYAAGVPGILSSNLGLFAEVSELLTSRAFHLPSPEFLWAFSPFSELSKTNVLRDWLGVQEQFVAPSAHIFKYLRPLLTEFTSSEDAFILAFDKFEYLVSLIHADFRINYEKRTSRQVLLFAPPGLFAYRRGWLSLLAERGAQNIIKVIDEEISQQGDTWYPLSAGLFGGSIERLNDAVTFAKRYFSSAGIPTG